MNKTVSILGCGWLGLPLAEFLITKGYSVKGSTTSPGKLNTLTSRKIKSFLIELNPDIHGDNIQDFFRSEILVINIPPGGGEHKMTYHKNQIESVLDEVKNSTVNRIIFISSTSVYGNENREITEKDLIDVLDLTIKKDRENKLVTFLCLLSAYTDSAQFNLSFNAPSSSGKSYIPLEIAQLFPQEPNGNPVL